MNASAARLLCLTLALLPGHALAAQEKPAVSVVVENEIYTARASITLPLESCSAWRLVTDYSGLPSFIPGLLQIRAKRISPTRVEVWQRGEVEVLFFPVALEASLEMEETPGQRIVFRQTRGDLQSYSGEWNLSREGEATRVGYTARITLKPGQLMPSFLARSVLADEVEKRFEALGAEASRRKNKSLPECVLRKTD